MRICEEVSKLARKAEQFYIIEYVRSKYVSRKHPDLGVRTAALPDAIIECCPADESLLAYVLSSKFADDLPLYRLVKILGRADIRISRQTPVCRQRRWRAGRATQLCLVQTCRNLDVNPQEYLEDVLRRTMGRPPSGFRTCSRTSGWRQSRRMPQGS